MTAAPSMAQRYSSSDDASFVPKKGQWQVSVLLGSGKFFNENTSYLLPKFSNDGGVVGLPNGGTDNSGDLNRYLNIGSLNNNSLVNIAGIEGKYFVSDNWDVNFQFSMNVSLYSQERLCRRRQQCTRHDYPCAKLYQCTDDQQLVCICRFQLLFQDSQRTYSSVS